MSQTLVSNTYNCCRDQLLPNPTIVYTCLQRIALGIALYSKPVTESRFKKFCLHHIFFSFALTLKEQVYILVASSSQNRWLLEFFLLKCSWENVYSGRMQMYQVEFDVLFLRRDQHGLFLLSGNRTTSVVTELVSQSPITKTSCRFLGQSY